MNILPKKNWHVRKKENIARVRKDEAEAAEKEKENERRAKLAEQEARISLLRKRARENDGDEVDERAQEPKQSRIEADIYTSTGNINFFKEHESGNVKTGTNEEYEAEKKAEKESYEKKIGLLTYLGQDSYEATGKSAWFMERNHTITPVDKGGTSDTEKEVGLRSKLNVDPLKEILKYTGDKTHIKTDPLKILKHTDDKLFTKTENTIVTMPEKYVKNKSKNLCRKDKKHKRERHKKKKKKHNCEADSETDSKRSKNKKKHSAKRSKKKSRNSSEDEEEKQKELAKLREERLKREARERKREERLLEGKDPDGNEKEDDTKGNLPLKQMYNSQFNPHLAKQNKPQLKNQIAALTPGVKYWLN